ncbi:hypothetical protein [Bacillus sp. NEAU-Y102]
MNNMVNEDKWVVVTGETPSNRIFKEVAAGLQGFSDNKQVLDGDSAPKDTRVYKDEEQRKSLDAIARRGGSVLIIGGANSGKTTLLSRLVRNRAEAVGGLIVIDSVTKEYVKEAIDVVEDKGWEVGTNTAAFATVTSIDVNKGFDTFSEYWNACGKEKVNFDAVVYVNGSEIKGIYKEEENKENGGLLLVEI